VYYYHLGLAQAGAGDKALARASLERALNLSPSFAGAEQARAALAKL
jgi:Tfp pilus assembly protein PilF